MFSIISECVKLALITITLCIFKKSGNKDLTIISQSMFEITKGMQVTNTFQKMRNVLLHTCKLRKILSVSQVTFLC